MNLVPFSKQYLRLNEALPFGVRDAEGRLLLAAGAVVANQDQLEVLRANELFADEAESSAWRRQLAAAVDSMLRSNASLGKIAAARPCDVPEAPPPPTRPLSLIEQWREIADILDGALREAQPDGKRWLERVQLIHERVSQMRERRLNASLYHLIYEAGHANEKYSAHHAGLCMLIAGEAARKLSWPDKQVRSLELAALTMNVSMTRLQDQLASQDIDVSPDMRAQIDRHAGAAAALLQACGVDDALWIEVVRRHHEDFPRSDPAALSTGQRVAQLLRRVDVFTAKMSRRARRPPMSPVQAAREACLGADGRPDALGAALLKAVGLYPPGSFVELVSGEIGIVVARGRAANQPMVAVLLAGTGAPFIDPVLRNTMISRYAVKGAVPAGSIKVQPPHARILALRA